MTLSSHTRLFVTGATGQLGRLVIQDLLRTVPAAQVIAGVRDAGSEGARELAEFGVEVRTADYAQPGTLATAFEGIDRLLLISSSEVGQRAVQHRNVITAAKAAGVRLIAYTSLLRADTSPLALAEEHRATEAMLAASGVPYVLLRNGWYTENYAASIPPALAHGVFLGSAGEGRIASAARADYAAAASTVMTADADQGGRIYELAGDESYTLSSFVKIVSQASGKPVAYQNLPETEFKRALIGAGLPEGFAGLLANSDAAAAKGALFDDSRQLSKLIGRPTTSTMSVIEASLKN